MLAGGTRRIVRTGPLDNLGDLPLELVRRIWRRVAELERETVEWLATRLQSLRRRLLARREVRRVLEFEDYVLRLVDPYHRPGNMEWLQNVYPQLVRRRIMQQHRIQPQYGPAIPGYVLGRWRWVP